MEAGSNQQQEQEPAAPHPTIIESNFGTGVVEGSSSRTRETTRSGSRSRPRFVAKGGSVSFEVLRFLVIDTAKSYLTAAACVTCWSTVVLDSLIIEAQTRR